MRGIRTDNLSRSFGKKLVFSSAKLETGSHGFVILRGRNGSGKTTLLRVLSTLTEPSTGDAWIAGHSVRQDPRQARAKIGVVFSESLGFYHYLTGLENLNFFGALLGLSRKETRAKIDGFAELFPIREALTTKFLVQSAGMRQALRLCRALLHDPRILLLDEPTRSLDTLVAGQIRSLLKALAETRVVLCATHYEA